LQFDGIYQSWIYGNTKLVIDRPTMPAIESSIIHFMSLEEQVSRLMEDYKKRSKDELERIISSRVDEKLREIEDIESEVKRKVNEQLLKQAINISSNFDRNVNLNSNLIENDLNDLIKRVERKHDFKESNEITAKKNELISCYKENNSRTLNCSELTKQYGQIVRNFSKGDDENNSEQFN
ncbi:2414_t:CDS:2, partial [Entrophospora sp. SA101]